MHARIGTVVLSAVLGAVLAFGLAACGSGNDESSAPVTTQTTETQTTEAHTTETQEPQASTTPKPKPKPKPKPIVVQVIPITVKGGRPVGGIQRPVVKKGRKVAIVVRADVGEVVHLHGYDIERPVRPGRPTRLEFTATIPGRFELELHHPDAVLADVTVKP